MPKTTLEVSISRRIAEDLALEATRHQRNYYAIKSEMDEVSASDRESKTALVNYLKVKLAEEANAYHEVNEQITQLKQSMDEYVDGINEAKWEDAVAEFEQIIPTLISDWSPSVADAIRNFAIGQGIPEEVVDCMIDPYVIAFVDRVRRKGAQSARSIILNSQ